MYVFQLRKDEAISVGDDIEIRIAAVLGDTVWIEIQHEEGVPKDEDEEYDAPTGLIGDWNSRQLRN
jgi:global regulator protein family protein